MEVSIKDGRGESARGESSDDPSAPVRRRRDGFDNISRTLSTRRKPSRGVLARAAGVGIGPIRATKCHSANRVQAVLLKSAAFRRLAHALRVTARS